MAEISATGLPSLPVEGEEGLHLTAACIADPRLAGAVARRPFRGAGGLGSRPTAFDAPAPVN